MGSECGTKVRHLLDPVVLKSALWPGAGVYDIYRGAGVDDIYRGAGVDDIYRGAGVDDIYRGAGVDDIYRGAGVDDIYRGAGVDEGHDLKSADSCLAHGRRVVTILSLVAVEPRKGEALS
ncbi:hypothetical protein NDU88_005566 [Pleurodeles waltl]|uniref:Uncharacterized protein n=1 Tax=Pleurodeles waltl TaxID=8319 RepID=A0AAV7L3E4_PLEWA|nr:hypothetical protein NDU88_005566 [Pleurodeles waltl]